MNKPPQLFKSEDTIDNSITAIRDSDTQIVRMSKRFAKSTNMPGDLSIMMLAYQKGAIDMMNPVLKALCKNCPSKGECYDLEIFDDCESYEEIKNIFMK